MIQNNENDKINEDKKAVIFTQLKNYLNQKYKKIYNKKETEKLRNIKKCDIKYLYHVNHRFDNTKVAIKLDVKSNSTELLQKNEKLLN